MPLLRPSIPTGWRLRLLRAFVAVFVYATHAMQAIAFEWKPGFRHSGDSVMKHAAAAADDDDDRVIM